VLAGVRRVVFPLQPVVFAGFVSHHRALTTRCTRTGAGHVFDFLRVVLVHVVSSGFRSPRSPELGFVRALRRAAHVRRRAGLGARG
jgi:hypothetical protein